MGRSIYTFMGRFTGVSDRRRYYAGDNSGSRYGEALERIDAR